VSIVEDGTYGDISFEPQAERAVYALARPGEVMYIGSLIAAEYFSTNLWEHVEEGRAAVKEKRNTLLDALETDFGALDGMHWTKPNGGVRVDQAARGC
jgi:DNA-binding transcriptional MocR family regulator